MKIDKSLLKLTGRLWGLLAERRKHQFLFLSLFMGLSSIVEVISIGAVIPFLIALTNPNLILEYINISTLNIKDDTKTVALIMSLFFCIALILSGLLRLAVLWTINKISYGVAADFGIKIYENILNKPYLYHVQENSSRIISGISVKVDIVINQIVIPILLIVSSAFTLTAVLLTTIFYSPIIFVILVSSAGVFYYLIAILVREILKSNANLISINSNQKIKIIQESLGGIRDVIIGSYQFKYTNVFSKIDRSLRGAQASNQFISSFPKNILEVIGTIAIVTTAYIINLNDDGLVGAIPILGMIALGAQRLLPIVQQLYNSWSVSAGAKESLADVIGLLENKNITLDNNKYNDKINYIKNIMLKDVNFRYNYNEYYILKNINININKGSKVGLVGSTGSGKSTLIDLMMGLLTPTNGGLYIDDRLISNTNIHNWQSKISHVPQNIYLSDESILENIAFGVERDDIDFERVKRSAKIACIFEAIDKLENKFDTKVGERGARLSGGQRQRIGVARALYNHNAEILFLDEATSAIDLDTEMNIIENIYKDKGDITIIMISHRVESLKHCDYLLKVVDGNLVNFEIKK